MSVSGTGNGIAGKSDISLLRLLKSADAGPVWTEFLHRYASFIMKTASQFEYEQERKNDCFLYVSEKLAEGGFKRLLKYDSGRGANFRTWLTTVIFNLCVDWHRKEFGRAILLPAISALPAFDQLVYRYCMEHGMASHDCLQAVRTEFPDVTRQQISQAMSRIHSVLTPRQRWQISVRHQRRQHPIDSTDDPRLQDVVQLSAPGPDPTIMAQKQQELDALHIALARLSSRQRLLLHLRFHDGLTLKQIAHFTRLGDSARAWRHIQEAMQALSDQFQSASSSGYRKK